ncbi:helix-turn-helix domain-containing protein [Limnohabitans sp.]|jgi:transcriptional regulator with XRE-family HTH domain|uniref:helix-turn-helix domain-containing protein n=1 Tax=Limnohabitans sp. TaxID=1907725 RepID=UPI0037BEFD02
MIIEESNLSELAKVLEIERKRQKLSREEAASVCGVSASFIRDAESAPQNCSLGKLVRLIHGLGLSLDLMGLPQAQVLGQHPARAIGRPDFGVSDDRIVTAQGEPS